jgi:hypothetical protein
MLCGTFNGLGLFNQGKFEEIKLSDNSISAIPSFASLGHNLVAMSYSIPIVHGHIEISDKMHHLNYYLYHCKRLFRSTNSSFLLQSGFFLTEYYPAKRRRDTLAKFPEREIITTYDVKTIDGKYYCLPHYH